jgi:hypothetical protein
LRKLPHQNQKNLCFGPKRRRVEETIKAELPLDVVVEVINGDTELSILSVIKMVFQQE